MQTATDQSRQRENVAAEPHTALPPQTPAPDFTLHSMPDQTVSLHDLRGRPVILAFYPADWSPVCSDQMAVYNEILPELERFGATLLALSVDGASCQSAVAHARTLRGAPDHQGDPERAGGPVALRLSALPARNRPPPRGARGRGRGGRGRTGPVLGDARHPV